MTSCSVRNCSSKSWKNKNVSFHTLPSSSPLRSHWIEILKRHGAYFASKQKSRVCSLHFLSSDFSITTTRRQLLPRAVPSVFPANVERSMFNRECVEAKNKQRLPPQVFRRPRKTTCQEWSVTTDGPELSTERSEEKVPSGGTVAPFVGELDIEVEVCTEEGSELGPPQWHSLSSPRSESPDQKSFLKEKFCWFLGEVRRNKLVLLDDANAGKDSAPQTAVDSSFELVFYDGFKSSSLYQGPYAVSALKVILDNGTEIEVKIGDEPSRRPCHSEKTSLRQDETGSSFETENGDTTHTSTVQRMSDDRGKEAVVSCSAEEQNNEYFHACQDCSDLFLSREGLERHRTEHHGLGGRSPGDGQFQHRSRLQCHEVVHGRERRLLCELCNRPFKHRGHLLRHLRWCARVSRPYRCLDCVRSFERKSELTGHRCRKRLAKNPFACVSCSASFRTSKELVRHRIQFHGQKPLYKCASCSERFASMSLLKEHKHQRHGTNSTSKSSLCLETFETLSALDDHRTCVRVMKEDVHL